MLAFYKDTEQAFSPAKGSKYAAGVDLYLPSDISLKPKCKVSIDLHVTVALPGPEYCGLLKLRSGAARRYDISIHEGLVDFDYGGSLVILVQSHSDKVIELKAGTSIVQLVPLKTFYGPLLGATAWDFPSERGGGGFGSTEGRRARDELLFATSLGDYGEEGASKKTAVPGGGEPSAPISIKIPSASSTG